jgi:hypothetical protein
MAMARPHQSSAKHAQAQSDAGDADSAASQSDNSSDNSDTSSATSTDEDSSGANSDGTVKVNNLANLEALLNIIANGAEILGIVIGGPLTFFGVPAGLILLFMKGKRWIGGLLLVVGPMILGFGLATPAIINWMVASARDGGWFN